MTLTRAIRFELSFSYGHTCAELVTYIKMRPEFKDRTRKSLMSSVSGILHKMWDKDEVYLDSYRKGPRGGMVYKLDKEV